ncbi:hypothetical protein KIN20_024557 [Parelaphostrongylus tenuis]|uniref:Endoplasmic reticulum transmembrane protein n=1 Tax=Parelaphostrongylus tenuis TaxID=148309 RepID=A0AAD5MTQ1_PARTN|nr:hypothetical protein KIN20_024557 [Parelaphostrongylus tenuis]
MTLQWQIVAGVLYVEIAVTFILLLPWIRHSLWSKFFKSRFVSAVARHGRIYSYSAAFVLFVLFADSVREVKKYSHVEGVMESSTMRHAAEADAVIHMRLFRAQRNFYISGFALLLFLVIKRIMGLISRGAQLEAASEAAMRQAESATKTAKTLMNASDDTEVGELTRRIEELSTELKKAQTDRDTLRKQAESLQDEYDRVSDLLVKFERGDNASKKDD